jgi:hypothetical protein
MLESGLPSQPPTISPMAPRKAVEAARRTLPADPVSTIQIQEGTHEYSDQQNTKVIVPGLHRLAGHLPRRQDARLRHQGRRRRDPRQGRHHPSRQAGVQHRADAVEATGADASIIYVPPPFAPTPSWKRPTPASRSSSASPRASRCRTCCASRSGADLMRYPKERRTC